MSGKIYPIGIQNFEKIRKGGYFYIDKTALVYQLVKTGSYYFLSRPRRFGKSLLISTLEAYFQGKRELFEGLAMEKLEKDWVKYPVLHLDLNTEKYDTPESLENKLNGALVEWEKIYGEEPSEKSLAMRFEGIIKRAAEVAEIVARGGKRPHLAAILVGHDGGSETYVAAKVKACEVCGFKSSLIRYESDVTEEELLAKVRELNEDDDVDGFIVQLPLPKHISEQKVIETIDYRKDVDGFHPINVGRMSIGLPCYVSATPNGILELLKRYEIETSGKKCVVLGRSNIVGKPMAALMMQKAYPGDATVTVCHSRSKDLIKECQEADIIIAALGQPNFVKAEMVKEGAVVIDVGTTRVPDATKKSGFKLTGDVKFDEVAPKCSFITPVPGGVGPMTIVSLMKNTLLAGKKAIYQ